MTIRKHIVNWALNMIYKLNRRQIKDPDYTPTCTIAWTDYKGRSRVVYGTESDKVVYRKALNFLDYNFAIAKYR